MIAAAVLYAVLGAVFVAVVCLRIPRPVWSGLWSDLLDIFDGRRWPAAGLLAARVLALAVLWPVFLLRALMVWWPWRS